MKMIGNISKFSWGELTSNSTGKTSGSGTSGFLTVVVGLIGFLFSVIMSACGKLGIEYVSESLAVIGIGSGLLGWRKKLSSGGDSSDATDIISGFTKTLEPQKPTEPTPVADTQR